MPKICFYFQVHQPYRVKNYHIFDIGQNSSYFDAEEGLVCNQEILKKVSHKCYLPTNKLLLKLLRRHPEFRISFSFSGVFLDQLENYYPEVLKSFQDLVETGRVEVLEETYYHSLAFIYSKEEFVHQVDMHQQKIRRLFGLDANVFRNTELIYNNDLARFIEGMGYKGIIAEGADKVLNWRSPNFLYQPQGCSKIKLLLKNYKLSDDIAFRFSDRNWKEHPLTSEKFTRWIEEHNGNGEIINLFMDYETFGEHQWEDSGIFSFLEKMPEDILASEGGGFLTPSEAIDELESRGEVDFLDFVSWADEERDLSAWKSNYLQEDALRKIYSLEKDILEFGDQQMIEDWRRLQTSDHFYYMCTKFFADGDVHKYFNPYQSPYEAFIAFMNAVSDLELRLKEKKEKFINSKKVAGLTKKARYKNEENENYLKKLNFESFS